MWPIVLGVAAIGGAAAVAYERWPAFKVFVMGNRGFSQPPVVNGYKAPDAGGAPPSWSYQGPLVPPAPPPPTAAASVPLPITLSPGNAFSKPAKGATLTWQLPAGARWADPSNPALVPTSLGGDISTTATSFTMSGLQGAATMQFSWIDASGKPQVTLVDVNVPL